MPFVDRAHHPVGDERGATAVEYALMAGLIAIVIVAAVALLGGNLADLFADETLSSALAT